MQDFKRQYGTVEGYLKQHPNMSDGHIAGIPWSMEVIYEDTDNPDVKICHIKVPVSKNIFD